MYSNSFRQCIVSVGLFDNAMNIFIFSSRAVIITHNIMYIPTKYTLHCNGDKDFPRSQDFPCSCINSFRLKHHPPCRCQAPLNYSQVYLHLMLLSIDRNNLVKEANQLAWPSTVFQRQYRSFAIYSYHLLTRYLSVSDKDSLRIFCSLCMNEITCSSKYN